MILRDYQQQTFNTINDSPRQLYVLATGGGKTVIFIKLIEQLLANNHTVAILTHRRILIDQIHTYIKPTPNLLIATKQSYANQLDFAPTHIIIDECHSVDFEKGQYKKIIDYHTDSIIIGFTATPIRMNNGLIYGEGKVWSHINYEIKPKELISRGWLCPYRVIVPREFADSEDLRTNFTEVEASEIMQKTYLIDLVYDSYVKYARCRTLIFAVDIKHAELLCERIPNSRIIHSKISRKEQIEILQDFKNGLIKCLININILTEGFDDPQVDTIILARPTKSIALHRQIVGRGLRIHDTKMDCLIIDLVSNFMRNGDINENLEDISKINIVPYYLCPVCIQPSFHYKKVCLHCGYSEPLKILEARKKEQSTITAKQFREIQFLIPEHHYMIIKYTIRGPYEWGLYLSIHLKDNEGNKKTLEFQLYHHTTEQKKRLYHDLNIVGCPQKSTQQELEDANLLYKIVFFYNGTNIYEISL